MSNMGILTWVIVGLVSGLSGNVLLNHPAHDALADFLLGAVGAILGGLISSLVFKMPDALDSLSLVAILFSCAGAIALIVFVEAVRIKQTTL